jgi:nucleoside-diphosphate-sugar epimerase
MKTILITGSNGYIGQHLRKKLKHNGFQIVDWNRINGDITQIKSQEKIDLVVHLAAQTGISESFKNPQETHRVNFEGTKAVADFCLARNSPLLFLSTCAYGHLSPMEPVHESHQLRPNNPYSMSKKLAEEFLANLKRTYPQFQSVTLRLFNVYGPQMSTQYVIPKIVSQIFESEEIKVNNIDTIRDFIYIDDVVDALYLALELMLKKGLHGTWNLGTGKPTSIIELLQAISLVYEFPLKIVNLQVYKEDEIKYMVANMDSFKKTFDWEPQNSLLEGLQKMRSLK